MSSYQNYVTTNNMTEFQDTVGDLNDAKDNLYHDLTKESVAFFNQITSQKTTATSANLNPAIQIES